MVKPYYIWIPEAIKNHIAEKYLRIFGYVWQNKLGENVINGKKQIGVIQLRKGREEGREGGREGGRKTAERYEKNL